MGIGYVGFILCRRAYIYVKSLQILNTDKLSNQDVPASD